MTQETLKLAQPEQEPVAWRTFDGEGGYDYRSYEDNESYADDWNKRNSNHAGWVDKLYTHSQPEQEPVAWMVYTQDGQSVYVTDNPTDIQDSQRALPIYTTPPQRTWVGLTDKERSELVTLHHGWNEYGQAIENKLKEKNT